MHMSDALITPLVGGTMLATSGGMLSYSVRKIKVEVIEKKLPLMAVMGAFVFASQMINFAIPATGSSGHIGGGMLLAILLGSQGGFITLASVLLIQALFFADGGLLALGCNLFNLGFFSCYLAYPYIFKPIVNRAKGLPSRGRLMFASIVATVVGLQLGSFSVVLETMVSGRSDLPFSTFLLFMQPIHLGIGVVEGLITAMIIDYLYRHNSDLIFNETSSVNAKDRLGSLVLLLSLATLVIGGFLSAYASSNPDGLEWSIDRTSGQQALASDSTLINTIDQVQEHVALLPDYQLNTDKLPENISKGLSGIIGSLIVLILTFAIGFFLRRRRRRLKQYE